MEVRGVGIGLMIAGVLLFAISFAAGSAGSPLLPWRVALWTAAAGVVIGIIGIVLALYDARR